MAKKQKNKPVNPEAISEEKVKEIFSKPFPNAKNLSWGSKQINKK